MSEPTKSIDNPTSRRERLCEDANGVRRDVGLSIDFVGSDIESSHHIAVNTEQNAEISFNNDRTDRMSSDSGQTPDDVCT